MSDQQANKSQEKGPPMPEYFRYDERKRQEFLSQVGTFSDEQRLLFNKLCDMWEPEASFSKVAIKLGITFEHSPFKNLMARLQGAHCGLLKMVFNQGNIEPEKVILTDRQDVRFYFHLVESEIERNFISDTHPFVNMKTLSEAGFTLPLSDIESIPPENISRTFASKNTDQIKIFHFEGIGSKGLLATPKTIMKVVKFARMKILSAFQSNNLLSLIAKLMNLKISDLQKYLKTEDASHWSKITAVLIKNREDILVKNKTLDKSLFIAAAIIQANVRNEISAQEASREDENRKRDKMKEIVKQIGNRKEMLISQKDLNDILEKLQKDWPDFKEAFYENHVKQKSRTGLAEIVFTGKEYIHRDHVYPLFRQELQDTMEEFTEFYKDLMTQMLKTRNRNRVTVFTNRDNFKSDIRGRIRETRPYLDSMLNKPKLVSEAIIHYGKNKLKIKSIDKMKEILVRYFYEGVIKFKDVDFLLNLYLKDLFERSYENLPFIRRIIMKLSGQYETYNDAYSGLSRAALMRSEKKDDGAHGARSRQYTSKSAGRQEGVQGAWVKNQRRSRRGGNAPAPQTQRQRAQPPKPSSRYSHKQIEDAWSEFDEVFATSKDKAPKNNELE